MHTCMPKLPKTDYSRHLHTHTNLYDISCLFEPGTMISLWKCSSRGRLLRLEDRVKETLKGHHWAETIWPQSHLHSPNWLWTRLLDDIRHKEEVVIAQSFLSRGSNEHEDYLLVMLWDWSQLTMASWPMVQIRLSSCFCDTTPFIHSLFMTDVISHWGHWIITLPIILKYLLPDPLEKTRGNPHSNKAFQTCTA